MQKNDLSRSLVAFVQNSTLVAVVELSLKTWLVCGLVPGLTRQPLKNQGPDPGALAGCCIDDGRRRSRQAVRLPGP
jgi:transposase